MIQPARQTLASFFDRDTLHRIADFSSIPDRTAPRSAGHCEKSGISGNARS